MSFAGAVAHKLIPARIFNALRVLKYPNLGRSLENLTYDQDGLMTVTNADFMTDDRFARAYKKGEETGS